MTVPLVASLKTRNIKTYTGMQLFLKCSSGPPTQNLIIKHVVVHDGDHKTSILCSFIPLIFGPVETHIWEAHLSQTPHHVITKRCYIKQDIWFQHPCLIFRLFFLAWSQLSAGMDRKPLPCQRETIPLHVFPETRGHADG